ncbi:Aminoglycoside 3'-phosphotransferase, partial (plasmid) [Escherichia coli]
VCFLFRCYSEPTFNKGVSFSLLAFEGDTSQAALVVVTGLLTLAMTVWAYRSQGWHRIALSLVVAGALANLIDRGARGSVTDFLPDEDKSTPQLDLLARVERELPVRLDQERTDMVVCHGDPCMPNFMVDPKTLQCTGLIDLGRLGTADRYADLALMIANAEENWAAPDEAERAFAVLFNVLGIEAPDRERLAFYLRLDPLTWG